MMLTGAAIGLAVGAAATMVSSSRKMNMRMMKRDMGKVVRAVGGMMDDIAGSVKF